MRKTFTAFAAVAASLSVAACGNKEEVIHHAETEGIYVNVGEMKYQVQISRALNPVAIPEDKTFVQGVNPVEAELGEGEVWFAIFVRIENETDEAHVPAEHFEIEDQQEEVYEPVEIDETNPFVYDDDPVPAGSTSPTSEGVAGQLTSIGGKLLLFKVKHETLDNRPLELFIEDDAGHKATIELDV